ncbi:uncharacterized protein LOC116706671 [Etheostoma spectabile]|uniref:uncharacterized protein LOC116706671 n=1 Tax=Etheostoma spectabile TaxID=54343 RepID=UPI0013AFE17F|nr:uncharacterized protein LOC116706671 [Etheostoma spectabile]
MDRIRWIMSSLLMLQVQFRDNLYISLFFSAAAAGTYSSSTVRVGDEVTLSCLNVTDDQDQCDSTEWLFTGSGNRVTLFEHGRIQEEAKAKSDRLRVTEKCSLVIKNVADEDIGRYICKQFRSGELDGECTVVYLSVVTMTEQKNDDTVTLFCSVLTYGGCVHTVKWLCEGNKTDMKTTQLDCSGTVTFTTSHLHQKSEHYELLKCEVTHDQDVQLSSFIRLQSSGEKPGDDPTTTISQTTN